MTQTHGTPDNGQQMQFGRYVVERLLGEGGMGKVYLAHDPVLGRAVAVKAVSFDMCLDEVSRREYMVRFTTEARASAKLNHQSVVTVFDAGEQDGTPWIAFEFVDGEGLDRILAREGRLPVDRAVAVAADIASALEHAHELGIVHRDVKPSNVLIDKRSGTAKLADFGVVRAPWSQVTQEGQAVGSPGYMSPEQIEGSDLDGRSDVFSLSIVLYQMVTGSHPFLRETLQGTCFATVSGACQPSHALAPEAPAELHRLVAAGLMPQREKRLGSARDMVQGLRDVPMQAADVQGEARTNLAAAGSSKPAARLRPVSRLALAAADRGRRFVVELGLFCMHLCGFGRSPERPSTGAVLGRQARRGFARMASWARTQAGRAVPVLRRLHKRFRVPRFSARLAAAGLVGILIVAAVTVHVRGLQRKVVHAPPAESMQAARTLERIPFAEGHELLLAHADSCMERDEIDSARAVLTGLLATDDVALRAHIHLALLERLDGDRDRSDELLGRIARIPNARREFRSRKEQVYGLLARLLNQGRGDTAAGVVAHTLKAADSRTVRAWMESPEYWLRWNAVRIRGAAGLSVDSVRVYALDLAHAGSMRTRARAARKLGELGDKRAVPALEQARDRGWQDPFVAAAASSSLELLGAAGE